MALTKIGVYQVVSALGDGPRGTVYLCKDRDGHRVAARIFPATTDPEGFLKAAAVLKALTAHHLALVEDFGIQEGRPFLANELVEGEALSSWLEESRPPGDQLKLIEGLLDALHAAHALGIVHARVQPSNVQVLPDGECRLLDLGVSTFAPGARASPTPYVAPELAEGGAASVKNDIYSAGVVCYEVLAGRPPFDPSASSGQTQSLRAVRPDLPRDLSDAVMACLDKDPEWRPKDLGYLLQVVKQLREAGLPKGARGASKPAPRPAGRAAPAPPPKASDRSGPPLLPIALGLVALAAGGYLLWGRMSAPPPVGPRQGPTTASPLPRPLWPDVAAPGLPPPEPPPRASATPAAPSPSPKTTPTPAASTPSPRAASPSPATPTPARTPAAPSPAVKPEPARPTPAPTPAAVVVPTPAPPAPTPSVPARAAPSPAPVASEPLAAPATLTTVVPRVLKKGATGIVDVHGLGLRSDHQIRVLKGRDPASGFTLVRQRRVSDSLIQAVVQVDSAAASGPYTLVVADRQGGLSNPLPIEVAR